MNIGHLGIQHNNHNYSVELLSIVYFTQHKTPVDMSYSQYFLPNLMDMGSLLGTILGTMLNYKRTFMSTVKGLLIRLILTVAHMLSSFSRS